MAKCSPQSKKVGRGYGRHYLKQGRTHTQTGEGRNAELLEEAILRPLIKVIALQKKRRGKSTAVLDASYY